MGTVIARAPGRVSLAGGGTDLPAWYEKHGGAVVSLGITRGATATISDRVSGLELVSPDHDVRELISPEKYARRMRHPFLSREFVTLHKAVAWHFGLDHVRLAASCEIPAGIGLGSSAAVCVALVTAAASHIGERMDHWRIAQTAARIEMTILRRPCGKQDPFVSAFGGINLYEFLRDGTVTVTPVRMSPESRRSLEDHLLLFTNGTRRNSAGPLGELARRISSDGQTALALYELRDTAYLTRTALERGDISTVGALVDRGWRAKRQLHGQVATSEIDRAYALARREGALGGKLAGAGMGGALLVVCPPERQPDIRQVLATQGWRAERVAVDGDGATVVESPERAASAEL
jgi:galactokinase/mevalonate kinase-like predicted kinase